MSTDDPARRLAAARLWAAGRMPYLATALFACTLRVAPASGTVAIDEHWRVHADPDTLLTLDVASAGRLLLHLVGHLLREHPARAQALRVQDDRRGPWQTCADAEINDDLAAARLLPPMVDVVPADLDQPDGDLAERYFTAVMSRPTTAAPQPGWDCGSGADGCHRPYEAGGEPGLDQAQSELIRHTTARAVREHATQQRGRVPGGWLRWAEALLPSRTDWRRVLAAEIRAAAAAVEGNVDYTYQRLSRRTGVAGVPRVLQPALRRPRPEVAVVCDTSGSMGEEELTTALTEIEAILARAGLRSSGLNVLAVDTEVQGQRRVVTARSVQLSGGGGTDMAAGIAAAAQARPRPHVIVVLTDGWTPWPERPPPGIRVVVGVIGGVPEQSPPPFWARVVDIRGDGAGG